MNDNSSEVNIRSAVEALLFASDRPLLLEQMKKALDGVETKTIRALIEELKAEYESQNRGLRIFEIAGGFQMTANPYFASFLKKLFKGPKVDRLSKPALETLAIIAYKQPVTKLEIESLRKVNIDGLMDNLLEKNLVKAVGRKKAPGNPKVYGTTREFLEYFGLRSLEELPKIDNFAMAASAAAPKEDIVMDEDAPASPSGIAAADAQNEKDIPEDPLTQEKQVTVSSENTRQDDETLPEDNNETTETTGKN